MSRHGNAPDPQKKLCVLLRCPFLCPLESMHSHEAVQKRIIPPHLVCVEKFTLPYLILPNGRSHSTIHATDIKARATASSEAVAPTTGAVTQQQKNTTKLPLTRLDLPRSTADRVEAPQMSGQMNKARRDRERGIRRGAPNIRRPSLPSSRRVRKLCERDPLCPALSAPRCAALPLAFANSCKKFLS